MVDKVLKALVIIVLVAIVSLIAFNLLFLDRKFLPAVLELVGREKAPVPTPVQTLVFVLPVKTDKMETIPPSATNSSHLPFFLPDKEPIYAAFDGFIDKVTDPTFKFGATDIQLVSFDGRYRMSYLLFGKSLVKKKDKVVKGQVIAEAMKGEGLDCIGGGNLDIIFLEDRKKVELTKKKYLEMVGR